MKNYIIAVDCDGTIFDHVYPDLGKPVPLALYYLYLFQMAEARLILWTMRSGPQLIEAVEECAKCGIKFWGINENPEQKSWTSSPKVYANIYIDDAAAGCPLKENPRFGGRPYVDWSIIGPVILEKITRRT